MATKFRDQISQQKGLQNTGKSEELPLLLSFAEFAHDDSPDNTKLHRKMNAALHEICKLNWRNILEKERHSLGGFEQMPLSQLKKVKIPFDFKKETVWVMCCGKKVGRLIGYIESIHSRTVFRLLRLDTFECYDHG